MITDEDVAIYNEIKRKMGWSFKKIARFFDISLNALYKARAAFTEKCNRTHPVNNCNECIHFKKKA